MLNVGDGQQLYWETYGNPPGKPGSRPPRRPGALAARLSRRPAFRSEQSQRSCSSTSAAPGRSTPRVAPTTDLSANTTDHLIADIERLREHLGIDRWLVWGNSWGVTLGLAYAQRHPTRVSEMDVSREVTMTRPRISTGCTARPGQVMAQLFDLGNQSLAHMGHPRRTPVMTHTNLYMTYQTAPGRTGRDPKMSVSAAYCS